MNRRQFNKLAAAQVAIGLSAPYISRAATLDKVRFCWTNTVSVSAQIEHTLKNTDIAAKHGLDLEMIQFAGGPPINEALVSGAADIGSVADFGAVLMMGAGAPLMTVARQSNFRSAVMATSKSNIHSLADLKGKQVYGLFGITAYQNAQAAVIGAGLTIGKDVNFVNIGTPELSDAVRAQKIEAFFMWDPWVTLFEHAGLARTLSQNDSPAMVLQSRKEYTGAKADVLRRFLLAHSEATFYASQNHALTDKWFQTLEPAKGIPTDVIERASSFDPSWNAKKPSDIQGMMSPQAIASMQKMADWGYHEKLLPRAPNVSQYIDTAIAKSVDVEMAKSSFDPASVKVTAKA